MVSRSREDVEEIRRRIFSTGGEPNPFTEDPHQPVEDALSTMMDAHFLKEQIQNAEDNEYLEQVDPSLEFVITSKDITNTGAPATVLLFNNEKGFLKTDIESICGVGHSTKKGSGFKSLFLITAQPHIFSHGYQIKFNEKPCQHCNVGYIVPEWVEEDAMLSAIKSVYGSSTPLPTTTLVLPLKPEKVKPVKDQLSSVHPEVLLFLAKIRRLSVREVNEDPKLNTVSAVSISSEKNFASSKSMDAGSYTLHLTSGDGECGYYMWKQRFAVKKESKVDVTREEVDEWAITLAFPIGERLKRSGSSLPGIYSFLPTETVTNFPFIIQADFRLASSRENIMWDNKWNQGILDCVPVAFVNAFTSLVKSIEDAPVSSLLNMFRFLPVNKSSHPKLNNVQDAIRAKLMNESIIPCESDTKKKLFCKPTEAVRLDPSFRSILKSARVSFPDISSHGAYLLPPSFDTEEYKDILDYLGIRHVDCKWYAKCINKYNLVMGVSEKIYIQLLVFIAEHWVSWSDKTPMKNIPLIKYVGWDRDIGQCTMESSKGKLLAADSELKSDCISWMIDWNREFRCPDVPGTKKSKSSNGNREFEFCIGRAFLPKSTQESIRSSGFKKPILVKWLQDVVGVEFVSIEKYAEFLSSSVSHDRKLVVTYARFLYTSFINDYLSKFNVAKLCCKMPILDKHGKVNARRSSALVPSVAHTNKNPKIIHTSNRGHLGSDRSHKPYTAPSTSMAVAPPPPRGVILVPAKGSRWVELFGTTDLWKHENYVEMGEDYTREVTYFGGVILGKELVSFLEKYGEASDVPCLPPPDAPIPTLSDPLTKTNTFLLLAWLMKLKTSWVPFPERFLSSIKNNRWLKVSLSGIPGYCQPSESFMLDSSIGKFLQDGLLPFSIALIDKEYYGARIRGYKEALQTIGVGTEDTEACEYIGRHLMSLAASYELTRDHSLWILKFTEFLGKNHISSGKFIDIVKQGKWIKTTSHGYMIPSDSVLFSQESDATASLQTSDIPFIDQDYYGKEILSFKKQLALLGVVVNFNESRQLLI